MAVHRSYARSISCLSVQLAAYIFFHFVFIFSCISDANWKWAAYLAGMFIATVLLSDVV